MAKKVFIGFKLIMNIQPISQNTFQGYDARPLRGFLMSSNLKGLAEEMKRIGDKEGFKIFGIRKKNANWEGGEFLPSKNTNDIWAQDLWSIVKGRLLTHLVDDFSQLITEFFGIDYNFTQKIIRDIELEKITSNIPRKNDGKRIILAKLIEDKAHVQGGNIFLVKGEEGDEVLIGENEFKIAVLDFTDIASMYQTDRITALPAMDFHLDLFIRPLDNKRILIADDKLSLRALEKIHRCLRKNSSRYSEALEKTSGIIKEFKKAINSSPYAQTDEVEKILNERGYSTIRVPGRIYGISKDTGMLRHYCNFINANVLKNKKDKLVYITNKSNIGEQLGLTPEIIQETGCSFEKAFVNSINPYIGRNHIYFVSGKDNFMSELLTEYRGGIHCICSEVPFND